jgi:hypothetical protein
MATFDHIPQKLIEKNQFGNAQLPELTLANFLLSV